MSECWYAGELSRPSPTFSKETEERRAKANSIGMLYITLLSLGIYYLSINHVPLPVAIFVHLVSLTTLVVLVAASVGARPRVKPRTTDKL